MTKFSLRNQTLLNQKEKKEWKPGFFIFKFLEQGKTWSGKKARLIIFNKCFSQTISYVRTRKFWSLWFKFFSVNGLIYSHVFGPHVWLLTLQPLPKGQTHTEKWGASKMSNRQHVNSTVQNQGQHCSFPMSPSIPVKNITIHKVTQDGNLS